MRRNDLWLVAIITALFFSSLTGCAGRSVVKDANALIAAAIDNPPWAGTERAVDRGVVIGRPTIEPGKRDRLDLASPALRSETVAMITRLDKALSQQIENLSMHQSVLYILIATLAASLIALAWYLWPWNESRQGRLRATANSSSSNQVSPLATATPPGTAPPIKPAASPMPAAESNMAAKDDQREPLTQDERLAQLIATNTVAMLAVADAMRAHSLAPIPPKVEKSEKGKKEKKGKKRNRCGTPNITITINNGGGGGGGACITSPPVATPSAPEEAALKTPETPAQEEALQMTS